eukprot:1209297-Prymnesium_polylepis.1
MRKSELRSFIWRAERRRRADGERSMLWTSTSFFFHHMINFDFDSLLNTDTVTHGDVEILLPATSLCHPFPLLPLLLSALRLVPEVHAEVAPRQRHDSMPVHRGKEQVFARLDDALALPQRGGPRRRRVHVERAVEPAPAVRGRRSHAVGLYDGEQLSALHDAVQVVGHVPMQVRNLRPVAQAEPHAAAPPPVHLAGLRLLGATLRVNRRCHRRVGRLLF